MPVPSAVDQIRFLTNVQRLLSEGLFTATYKYGLLSALADLSVERGDDSGEPLHFSLFSIAEKFIGYYWRQSLPYAGAEVLRQNTGGRATVLTLVQNARTRYGEELSALKRDGKAWKRLVNDFIPTLKEQPLWRLQKVGTDTLDFLYGPSPSKDSIELRPGVAYCFRKFHPLLQDIVQSAWVRAIRTMNGELLKESTDLSEFLFGSERSALNAARPILTELQNGLCFYCSSQIRPDEGEIDHFVPWAKYPVDLAHNLVLADRKCNGKKRDRLPHIQHLMVWSERNKQSGDAITAAVRTRIPCDLPAAMRIARWAYSQTEAAGGRTWVRADEMVPLSSEWRALFDNC